MTRPVPLALFAIAAIIAISYKEAASQERMPTVPSKQLPQSGVSLAGNVPTFAPVDTQIERTSLRAKGDVTEASNPLEELAWMVGDWVEDGENASIEASVNWSKNGAFLIRSFKVSNVEAKTYSGMQIIAWDPAEKRFRSWTYDSRGGFGEESWSRSGDRWSIRTRFTLPDGGRASAVHVMTRVGNDAFRWKSVNRVIDGSLQPDIDEVTIVRKVAEPAASAPESSTPQGTSTPEGENRP